MRKIIEEMIPYGQFFTVGKFFTHVLVLVLRPFFRITVTGVVWQENKRGKRKVLIIKKLSQKLVSETGLPPALLYVEKCDLPKGGWRDGDGDFFESLMRAQYRELWEEARIGREAVLQIAIAGVAFEKFSKHNRHRHGWFRFGKFLVVFTIQVPSGTKWQQGPDFRIHDGRFMKRREIYAAECFKPKSARYAILRACGF